MGIAATGLDLFVSYVLLVLLFFMFFYFFKYPDKSFLFGRKWMFDNQDVEPSDAIIRHYKKVSIIGMSIIVIVTIFITIKSFAG